MILLEYHRPIHEKTFHLVVRFSDNLIGIGDVVGKHNEVVAKYGFVWFGKLGNPLSLKRIDMLNEQLSKGVLTYVYLVKGNQARSTAYRATLFSLARELAPKEQERIPRYYFENDLVQYMKSWLKIGEIEPIEMSGMGTLKALGSINSIQETLGRSASGYFLVHEAKNIF